MYNDERIRGVNGRPFVLDIFLRLAKPTLNGPKLEILKTIDVEHQESKIDLGPHDSEQEYERLNSHIDEIY